MLRVPYRVTRKSDACCYDLVDAHGELLRVSCLPSFSTPATLDTHGVESLRFYARVQPYRLHRPVITRTRPEM